MSERMLRRYRPDQPDSYESEGTDADRIRLMRLKTHRRLRFKNTLNRIEEKLGLRRWEGTDTEYLRDFYWEAATRPQAEELGVDEDDPKVLETNICDLKMGSRHNADTAKICDFLHEHGLVTEGTVEDRELLFYDPFCPELRGSITFIQRGPSNTKLNEALEREEEERRRKLREENW